MTYGQRHIGNHLNPVSPVRLVTVGVVNLKLSLIFMGEMIQKYTPALLKHVPPFSLSYPIRSYLLSCPILQTCYYSFCIYSRKTVVILVAAPSLSLWILLICRIHKKTNQFRDDNVETPESTFRRGVSVVQFQCHGIRRSRKKWQRQKWQRHE